jgi:RES domain-containing protein
MTAAHGPNDNDDELTLTVRAAAEWTDFADGLAQYNRVVAPNQAYLEALLAECFEIIIEWVEPHTIFRARIMSPTKEDLPFGPSQMGVPPAMNSSGGRLNPPGIPYLYAAMDTQTAIAEVRPWRGARVTVASFRTIGRIRCVDLSDIEAISMRRRRAAFAAHMMQRPTHRDDNTAYVATQFLSEHLKARGADGVLYKSSLHRGGINVALFRPEAAQPTATQLWQVGAVTYESYELTDMQGAHPHSYD